MSLSSELPLKLSVIPENLYSDFRTDVIFNAYKWDPQVADSNTIANYVLLLKKEEAEKLNKWVLQLALETMQMEEIIISYLHKKDFTKVKKLAKKLGLPPQIIKLLPQLSEYKREQNVRLLRFDFHPVSDQQGTGWAISEVNSDVPGGMAEAAIWPQIAKRYLNCGDPGENVAQHLLDAFLSKINKNGTVAFVHATSYSDDRQVMQFLGDYFNEHGLNTIYAAPDHIKWIDKKAYSIINEQKSLQETLQKSLIDGIVRFFPLEWLINLPGNSNWQGYYDCQVPSCNNPAAIFAQSKRLPLIWDSLGFDIPAWRTLLPETKDPLSVKGALQDDSWIYKPALGRVGEGISIKEAISAKEMNLIQKDVKKNPEDWILQKRFNSMAIPADDGKEFHLCIGVFTVDGKSAGFYGRISPYPRIDANAIDIPILII